MFQRELSKLRAPKDNLTEQAGIIFGVVAAFASAFFALFVANGESHLTIAILLARIIDIYAKSCVRI
jgi:hypothetical protein